MKRLIIVHGDKGGVGKSMIAHATAAALLGSGRRPVLVEADAKNPGFHRMFDGKPDPVHCHDIRNPAQVDAMLDLFIDSPGDMLVDLPAAGSDMTANFLSEGFGAGETDIRSVFPEIGARLVVMFVIDPSRDALVALNAEMKVLTPDVADWIVVRNHREERPFELFDASKTRAILEERGTIFLDMPRLDPRVVEIMTNAGHNLLEVDDCPGLSALQKIRARAALRKWSTELEKAGGLLV